VCPSLLLAGLTFEIGYPILYDKFLRLGAAAVAGLGADGKQFFSASRIAFKCTIHQLLEDQLKPRCSLRSSAFAVCGESILDFTDDVADELAVTTLGAALGRAAIEITRNTLFESKFLGDYRGQTFYSLPGLPATD
jgi:hypothetical protein